MAIVPWASWVGWYVRKWKCRNLRTTDSCQHVCFPLCATTQGNCRPILKIESRYGADWEAGAATVRRPVFVYWHQNRIPQGSASNVESDQGDQDGRVHYLGASCRADERHLRQE